MEPMNDMILDIRKDPYNYVMRVVFCRWKPFILQAMDTDEVTNFSRFIKQLPITQKVLSQNLKADDLFLNQNGRGDTRYSEAAVIGRGDRHLIVSVMLRGEYGFAYDEAVVKTADYILEQME